MLLTGKPELADYEEKGWWVRIPSLKKPTAGRITDAAEELYSATVEQDRTPLSGQNEVPHSARGVSSGTGRFQGVLNQWAARQVDELRLHNLSRPRSRRASEDPSIHSWNESSHLEGLLEPPRRHDKARLRELATPLPRHDLKVLLQNANSSATKPGSSEKVPTPRKQSDPERLAQLSSPQVRRPKGGAAGDRGARLVLQSTLLRSKPAVQ
eukprot:TRINITY_DN114291_c0_g1_i1.p1 TRINITY_DN114291_c0_g1~~TRINITY_DN114291_c0_g1_i1.p1  ORF type:complete len:211 (-),score=38.06 TRINITY_DN114291_c0_g1_i1:79-711(-)